MLELDNLCNAGLAESFFNNWYDFEAEQAYKQKSEQEEKSENDIPW